MTPNSMDNILVPTDLSDFGKIALRYAEMFREKLGSHVTVMMADEPIYPLGMVDAQYAAKALNSEEVRQRLQKSLEDYVRESVSHPDEYGRRLIEGRAAPTIVKTAEEMDADLIIMGTHGRSGWQRALLGSVTERVLRHTSRPVLTVTPPAASAQNLTPEAARRPGEPFMEALLRNKPVMRTILCPVNFSAVARDALHQASDLARSFNAELIVMHVVEDDVPLYTEAEIGKWVPREIREQTLYRQLWVYGDAAERVLRAAEETEADLIVLGAQHKRFRDSTLFGSTTERITRFARQPVLTVVRSELVAKRSLGAA